MRFHLIFFLAFFPTLCIGQVPAFTFNTYYSVNTSFTTNKVKIIDQEAIIKVFNDKICINDYCMFQSPYTKQTEEGKWQIVTVDGKDSILLKVRENDDGTYRLYEAFYTTPDFQVYYTKYQAFAKDYYNDLTTK